MHFFQIFQRGVICITKNSEDYEYFGVPNRRTCAFIYFQEKNRTCAGLLGTVRSFIYCLFCLFHLLTLLLQPCAFINLGKFFVPVCLFGSVRLLGTPKQLQNLGASGCGLILVLFNISQLSGLFVCALDYSCDRSSCFSGIQPQALKSSVVGSVIGLQDHTWYFIKQMMRSEHHPNFTSKLS